MEGHFLWFRELRFKAKNMHTLWWCTCAFGFRGIPEVGRLISHYYALLRASSDHQKCPLTWVLY